MPETVLEAVSLARRFGHAGDSVLSVDHVSLTVRSAEVLCVMGPSGSGKSSLLHLLAGLDTPDKGVVRVAGRQWGDMTADGRASFRRRNCGFVPQGFSLLPAATASENVELPLLLEGVPPDERESRTQAALAGVDLLDQARKLPDQLSGGQQQRVAIARSLVFEPRVLLADEPTASLDSANAAAVTELLIAVARRTQTAVVIVTHDPMVAAMADHQIRLVSGRLQPEMAA